MTNTRQECRAAKGAAVTALELGNLNRLELLVVLPGSRQNKHGRAVVTAGASAVVA